MNYYTRPWKLYWRHSGRATRREFWIFSLANGAIMGVIDELAGVSADFSEVQNPAILPLALLWRLVIIVPLYATLARRMHDVDRRGWWGLVPIAGLIFAFMPGTAAQNRFGSNPRCVSADSNSDTPPALSDR